MRKRRTTRPDFREILFAATGAETDLARLDLVDVADNLLPELDTLRALAHLMMTTTDSMEPEDLEGLGWELRCVQGRMRRIIELTLAAGPRKKAR